MPAPALPFTLQVLLSTTPAPGSALVADPALLGQSTSERGSCDRYALTGSGSKALDFGAMPAAGAKLVLVYYESGTAVITVGSTEVSPGGVYLVYNPAPGTGLTSLTITHTADAVVRCRILG
jgi:hypothetical protein